MKAIINFFFLNMKQLPNEKVYTKFHGSRRKITGFMTNIKRAWMLRPRWMNKYIMVTAAVIYFCNYESQFSYRLYREYKVLFTMIFCVFHENSISSLTGIFSGTHWQLQSFFFQLKNWPSKNCKPGFDKFIYCFQRSLCIVPLSNRIVLIKAIS